MTTTITAVPAGPTPGSWYMQSTISGITFLGLQGTNVVTTFSSHWNVTLKPGGDPWNSYVQEANSGLYMSIGPGGPSAENSSIIAVKEPYTWNLLGISANLQDCFTVFAPNSPTLSVNIDAQGSVVLGGDSSQGFCLTDF